MENIHTPELMFYQKIGELFYAVAASDKIVREEEYKVLTELVENEWKNIDDYTDEFETDAAYQIAIVFEWFDYESMDAEDCFDGFVGYYKVHKNQFSENKKKLIVNTVNKIAWAFRGSNKSELIMIAKVELLFKQD